MALVTFTYDFRHNLRRNQKIITLVGATFCTDCFMQQLQTYLIAFSFRTQNLKGNQAYTSCRLICAADEALHNRIVCPATLLTKAFGYHARKSGMSQAVVM